MKVVVKLSASVVLLVLALLLGGYLATRTTGDWVILVAAPNRSHVRECYKLTGTMLRTNFLEDTITWRVGSREVTYAKGSISRFPVRDGQWEPAFSSAGVDGELCTNGPYPDRDVLAQRAIRDAAKAAGAFAQEAAKTLQKAGEAVRDLMQKQ